MLAKLIFTLVIVGTVLGTFALTHYKCAHRNFSYRGDVCVCNATYCDNVLPFVRTAKGVVTSYVTSVDGYRFYKSQVHFSVQNSSSVQPNGTTIQINIDHSKKYQKIIGFGGAFTDATGINVGQLSKEMQTRFIKDYFGEDGIEYTLGRIPIGGTDYSTRPYTYHEVEGDDNLTRFALQPEDFKYKIPLIHLAQQVSQRKIRLFGSPWSSPAWIKTNHEVNHGGFIIGKPGERYYKIFARYFVKFIEEYAKNHVDIWGLTVENEPGAAYKKNYSFNSLGFNGTLERDFVKLDLGPELHAAGFTSDKLKVMIYDDNVREKAHNIEDFASTILSDIEAEKFVSGIAYHWYVHTERKELERLHYKFPNKFILGSEACRLHQPKLGEWVALEEYASNIIRDLNHYSTGWTDWNMALDPMGHPHWNGPDHPGVSSPVIVNATSQEYYKQPTFYAMGHFSKFILPDSVRVHHELRENNNTHVTVFQRPDNATVLTILNLNQHAIELTVHDQQNGHFNIGVRADALETLIWY